MIPPSHYMVFYTKIQPLSYNQKFDGFNDINRLLLQIQNHCIRFEDMFELEVERILVSGSINSHFPIYTI